MKRYLMFLMVSVTVVMLLLATTATVFGVHDPLPPNPADENVSDKGHFASCAAQGIVVHSAPATPNVEALHHLWHEQCDDIDWESLELDFPLDGHEYALLGDEVPAP